MSVGRTPILLRTQEDVTAAVGTVSIALVLVYAMFRRLWICAVRGGFMRVALAIAFGSCLLATASEAVAQIPPNDTDLKAAFCAGVLKSFIEGSEKSQPSTDPAIASSARKSKEQLFAAQQRVLAYLMPRMQFVDQTSLIVRRQNIWRNVRRRLAECRARLGVDVRRRACGAASGDVRWSGV